MTIDDVISAKGLVVGPSFEDYLDQSLGPLF